MSKKPVKLNQHYATTALKWLFITTIIFTVLQMVCFMITQTEQSTLIEWYFKVLGVECGGMLLKRVSEKIFPKKNLDDDSEDMCE